MEIEGMWETWRKSIINFCKNAPGRNRCHPHAIFVIMRSGGNVVKIATHLRENVSAYALHARYIFWIGKNMAAPSKLILQMVMYLHAGSHIKPWRVKMHMQMREGRKGHKKNKHGSVMMIFLLCCCDSLLLWTRID